MSRPSGTDQPDPVASTEANPADVEEQRQPVAAVSPPPAPTKEYDVPEADAWEQSMEVPLDDDADRP